MPQTPVRILAAATLALALAVAAFAQTQTASQFYTKYRDAFDKATSIDDLVPYLSKPMKAQVEATPAADRSKMFEMMKMMGAITDMKILKETRSADGATLTVEALDPDKKKTTGTVQVVKEDGEWKLGTESWSSGG
jgi:hypothetical protein